MKIGGVNTRKLSNENERIVLHKKSFVTHIFFVIRNKE